MPTPGQELSSIDFAAMLGGPLVAVVNAQSQAAMASVNFIKQVGFKTAADPTDADKQITGDPIYVTFKYDKEVQPFQPAIPASGNNPAVPAVAAVTVPQQLQVP